MAQGSKTGACSSHTTSAKSNCLKHNRREQVPGYVNPHLTHNNRTIFEADCIRDRKSILPLVKTAEREYVEKTGQKCQKSFAPFRESVLVVREGVSDEELKNFIRRAETLTGWKAVGCWLHLDEGHAKSKYIEGQEGFALNAHAHVLWDCQDHRTGKAVRCDRNKLSKMQDILARSTGMERGNKASDTGIKGRSAREQRIEAQEERMKILTNANDQLAKDNQQLTSENSQLKEENQQLQGENQELKAENQDLRKENERLKLGNAVKESAMGLFGQSSKDKKIEKLTSENSQLKETTAKAIEDRDDALQKAENASKTAEERTIKDIVRQSGIGWPQWEGFSIYGLASKIKDLIETKDLWYQSNQRLERENEKLKRQLSHDEDLRRGRGM